MARLALEDVAFSYGKRPLLEGLRLEFPDAAVTGIIGPNGCGKSTLISLLAHLRAPTRGRVLLDGRPVADFSRRTLARRIGFLPQNPACPPGVTVGQVLRYGRRPHQSFLRQFDALDGGIIDRVARVLHLGHLLERPMEFLSGGQRQKAWLGMVLAQDTDVVLLDEPTSALDIGHQHEVLECVRALGALGKTVVMVIHDLAAAGRFCDHLVALEGGRLVASGPARGVIDASLVLRLFGVHAEVLVSPASGCPVVVPLGVVRD